MHPCHQIEYKYNNMAYILEFSTNKLQRFAINTKTSKIVAHDFRLIRKINKKAVQSQRWPRDACYISRSWAVAEICPFEIIHDGDGCHLEFVRLENSAIRFAIPENPTL